MDDIARILGSGRSAREPTPVPAPEEFAAAEAAVGFRFPDSYRQFVGLGGLGELRINHKVLSPREIARAADLLGTRKYVPFADNHCGDYYCWANVESREPAVFFADHESGEYTPDASSFVQWLEQNRF
jgi:hypothetical protein